MLSSIPFAPVAERVGLVNGKTLSVCSSPNTAANLAAMATPSVLTELPQSIMAVPFCGTATTMVVALQHGRNSIGVELDTDYCKLAASRLLNENSSLFGQARFQIELKPHAAVEAVAVLAETWPPYRTGAKKKLPGRKRSSVERED